MNPRTIGRKRAVVAVAALTALVMTACGDGSDPGDPSGGGTGAPATPGATDAPGGGDTGAIEDGLYFVPPVEGAELVFEQSGDAATDTRVTVRSVDGGGDGQTVTAAMRIDTGAGETDAEYGFVTGADGGLTVANEVFMLSTAMGMGGEDLTVTASGDDVVIPPVAELEDGATSSGEAVIDITAVGRTLSNDATFTVSGGGYESVTVPAGTFEAYVVEIALEIETSMGVADDGTVRFWFVPGFGRVQQETSFNDYTLTDRLTSSTVTP